MSGTGSNLQWGITMRRLIGATWLVTIVILLATGPQSTRAEDEDSGKGYAFNPNEMYRMPTHFGPSTGPRRGPHGEKFENVDAPKTTSIAVSFLTKTEQLEKMLPEGFSLDGEPVVTVGASYIKEIPWLAGRGYNTLGVSFPVLFQGEEDRARGSLLLVLWENLTDPIITGREELGFAKVYAELPEPRFYNGGAHVTASWMGFKFLDLHVSGLEEVPVENSMSAGTERDENGTLLGTLHYKYFPRTGEWGTADIAYPVLTPRGHAVSRTEGRWRGDGSLTFHEARWEDMPTQYQIVNAFANLEVLEFRGATMRKRVGGGDLSYQRILK